MKEITVYELIKLIEEDQAPEKIYYNNKIYDYKKQQQDYSYPNTNDWFFINLIKTDVKWLDQKIKIEDIETQRNNFELEELEEYEELINFDELEEPYGHNEQFFTKHIIIYQSLINKLIRNQAKLINKILSIQEVLNESNK